MIRHGQENEAIVAHLITWARELLLTEVTAALPDTLVRTMKEVFSVPHCALRLWSVKPRVRRADLRRAGGGRHRDAGEQHAGAILRLERRLRGGHLVR